MDGGRESGFLSRNVVQIIPGILGNGGENGRSGSINTTVWAKEDDYKAWIREASIDTTSNSNFDGRQTLTRSGSEPPNKKSRYTQLGDSPSTNRSRVIGKMFFKTKLCCKFRAGTCPFVTNCNFAHSIEELRKPPPNWQEIVAAHEEERGVSAEPREGFQIPSLGSSCFSLEAPRSYKGQHCKKFYTEEGCPYGDKCNFTHDEQLRDRESVAISLGPGFGGGFGAHEGGGGGASGTTLKPPNWKTRICNKWEQTGSCPFGNKCNFAHGVAELHRFGGGLVETGARDFSAAKDPKYGSAPSKTWVGVPSQRLANTIQRTGRRPHQKWKGPDKISLIYGDWIGDLE